MSKHLLNIYVETMSTAIHHASGCRGLPGNEELTGKKCRRIIERFAGNSSLPEADVYGQRKNGHDRLDETKKWAL